MPVQLDGLNNAVVYGNILLSIKINNTQPNMTSTIRKKTCCSGTGVLF